MKISDFLAMPSATTIDLVLGDTQRAQIDPLEVSRRKEEILTYCASLPKIANSWRMLVPYAENSELLAKLLVVIGQRVGAWTAYPEQYAPTTAWTKECPIIIRKPSLSAVPKPSRGDLAANTTECPVCFLQMGEPSSSYHDLVREEGSEYCQLCATKSRNR